MDQNQTPTPQPDYSFIANQPGPNGELPGQDLKQKSKKPILVAVVAVFAVLALGMTFLLGNTKDNQTANLTPSQQAVFSYIEAVRNRDIDKAYDLLSPVTRLSKDTYTQVVAPTLVANFDLSQCNIQKPAETTVTAQCLSYDDNKKTALIFQTETDKNGTVKITKHDVAGDNNE
jgi:hypothetical protein